jgi:hypothetical protein
MSVLETWGERPDGSYYESSSISIWILMNTPHLFSAEIFASFKPAPSVEKPSMLAVWPSRAALDAGDSKRLRGKPGKMVKRMFPDMTPQDVEKFANWYSEKYASVEYELHVADDADSFDLAYSHDQADYKNPFTTNNRKSLATSCMRHSFNHEHPARAYASGDFNIVYLTDSYDRIAGRCVVRKEPPVSGPIYGVSESALDQIETYLNDNGVSDRGDWIGAKLERIEHGDGFIAPYLDLEPRALSDNGDCLVISTGGEIDANEYGGVLGHGMTCSDCDSHISEDEQYSSECGNGPFCENCYHERYQYCEVCDCDVSADSMVSYNVGSDNTEHCCDSCRDELATETESGNWWKNDEVLTTKSGIIISTEEYNDEYFTSDWNGEIYHNSDTVNTADGGTISKNELPDSYEEIDGIWHDMQLKLELEKTA